MTLEEMRAEKDRLERNILALEAQQIIKNCYLFNSADDGIFYVCAKTNEYVEKYDGFALYFDENVDIRLMVVIDRPCGINRLAIVDVKNSSRISVVDYLLGKKAHISSGNIIDAENDLLKKKHNIQSELKEISHSLEEIIVIEKGAEKISFKSDNPITSGNFIEAFILMCANTDEEFKITVFIGKKILIIQDIDDFDKLRDKYFSAI